MSASENVRRLVVGLSATGLLAGGAALGVTGTASAAPAPTVAATTVAGDHGDQKDRCDWKKGHWEKKWVKGHWEKKWHHTKTWHDGYRDKHGKWHHGYWEHGRAHTWVYVHGYWHHFWIKGHWDCDHR